jgi:hypothetical protein
MMHILYYITSHGHGHAVRSCTIGNLLSPEIKLTIRTSLPKSFFQEELTRPFDYFPGTFDCGCIQTDGITVDIQKTLETYMGIARQNEVILEQEVQWCKKHRVTGIVSDIVPFAFEVADQAGIPSVGISNFSWSDIYEPYLDIMPSFRPYLEKIRSQYAKAGLLLALFPPNAMSDFTNRVPVSLVAKKGINIIDKIKTRFNINSDKRVGLIYTGNFGMGPVAWNKLEQFPDWEFIGLYPLPNSPRNYHLLNKSDFPYKDISASVDLLISKIGYGVFSECLANGIPLIYTPRTDFAEHPVLEKAIQDWGHGYSLSYEDYYNLNWEDTLTTIISRKKPKKIEPTGTLQCARRIEQFFKD